MKTKLVLLTSLSVLWTSFSLNSQDYKIPVENAKDGILSLSGFSGDITLEGYPGNEIIFTSDNLSKESPERAKGLKPVYPAGTDNTGIGLSVEKNGNQVTVTCLLPFTRNDEYTIKVPENLSLKIQSSCENYNDLFVKKMKNEIEIQTCGAINLTDVSGPLVLSTISGDINVALAGVNMDKPFSINSVSGEIDITLPAKITADIEMGSVSGAMYSDFDLNSGDKDMKHVGGNHLTSKLNGGGTRFSIVTVSGNIYLRKGN
jgi:lia operon protein LiaG